MAVMPEKAGILLCQRHEDAKDSGLRRNDDLGQTPSVRITTQPDPRLCRNVHAGSPRGYSSIGPADMVQAAVAQP